MNSARLRSLLWNQLSWMEDRGINGILPNHKWPSSSLVTPKLEHQHLRQSSNYEHPGRYWRLGFYTSSALITAEQDMLLRIIQALGFDPLEVLISANSTDDFQNCSYVVALGAESGRAFQVLGSAPMELHKILPMDHSRNLLIIPHPKAMLLDATLKISAWSALKNLKLALTC